VDGDRHQRDGQNQSRGQSDERGNRATGGPGPGKRTPWLRECSIAQDSGAQSSGCGNDRRGPEKALELQFDVALVHR
jgi:hypothetical protein